MRPFLTIRVSILLFDYTEQKSTFVFIVALSTQINSTPNFRENLQSDEAAQYFAVSNNRYSKKDTNGVWTFGLYRSRFDAANK